MNDQVSRNIYKEKVSIVFSFFYFKEMFLKNSFNGPFGLHSSVSFAASENIYNILWFSV